MIVVSLSTTVVVEMVKRMRTLSSADLIVVNVVIHTDGTRHKVEVPRDWEARTFMEHFADYITPRLTSLSVQDFRKMYKMELFVQRDGTWVKIEPNRVLRDNGVVEGDLLKIVGKIKPEFRSRPLG